MRYDLRCLECDAIYQVQCTLEMRGKLNSCHAIKMYLSSGAIQYQYDAPRPPLRKAPCYGQVETDYRTQKPIRYNINWIPTDRT